MALRLPACNPQASFAKAKQLIGPDLVSVEEGGLDGGGGGGG